MSIEVKALLQRIVLAALAIAFLALFFSTAVGLMDGDLVERFGFRLRLTSLVLLLAVLPIGLAWPRPSTTFRQGTLRTLLDMCSLSAIQGAYLLWHRPSADGARAFLLLGPGLYCAARLAGMELDRSNRTTETGAEVTSAWSVLRPRLALGLLAATAIGALTGLIGRLLFRVPLGLLPMIRGGIAFAVCALFPALVGKWVMEVAHREIGPADGVSEELLRLAGRRALRRGGIVGAVLVPALPALAGALTMSVKYTVLIAITGHICYWGEFSSSYSDWKRGQ